MRSSRLALGLIVTCGLWPSTATAIDTTDTRFLNQPAIGGGHVAFVYANDLWVANTDGTSPRRLTSDEGVESNPVFSPDGEWIAFDAEYDGNTDVYIVPVTGGIPTRLTWHPYDDRVCSVTPDGSEVLFRSARDVFTRRHTQLFTVPVVGGFPERLDLPNAVKASYSPDGTRLAYTPLGEQFRQWKNYRGGTATTIWLYTFADHATTKIPQPPGRSNDTDPMWIGNRVYFISDRNGEFNLFTFDPASGAIEQLTRYTDFPIVSASYGDGLIVFERAATLSTFDVETGAVEDLQIGIATDLQELRPRYVKGADIVRSADISPSGSRAVFDIRGEIVTLPAEKGDPRNLTLTADAHERGPAWSPDGDSIAYFSDASSEYELTVAPQNGKGEVTSFALTGTGFYNGLSWSPDSKKIAFEDNGRNLYFIDLVSGEIKKIGQEPIYNPGEFGFLAPVWSLDSAWIAFTTNNMANMEQVFLYSIEKDQVSTIADGLSDVGNPVFDRGGKYLYFFGSTDAGPVRQWFAMSNADMEITRSIYLVTLQKGVPSPLAKESDEEEGKNAQPDDEKGDDDAEDEKEKTPVTIDFDGLANRILALPVDAGNYFDLQAGSENT
ncbi:MAG: hypothetical protein MUP13_04665, partial [Thermoanaerobaculales bacterium]|nr:hypothetical protein [Thermoanaerobaculales bacterium]